MDPPIHVMLVDLHDMVTKPAPSPATVPIAAATVNIAPIVDNICLVGTTIAVSLDADTTTVVKLPPSTSRGTVE